jgi:hypothetical protein
MLAAKEVCYPHPRFSLKVRALHTACIYFITAIPICSGQSDIPHSLPLRDMHATGCFMAFSCTAVLIDLTKTYTRQYIETVAIKC